jgi:hypothetical protein
VYFDYPFNISLENYIGNLFALIDPKIIPIIMDINTIKQNKILILHHVLSLENDCFLKVLYTPFNDIIKNIPANTRRTNPIGIVIIKANKIVPIILNINDNKRKPLMAEQLKSISEYATKLFIISYSNKSGHAWISSLS